MGIANMKKRKKSDYTLKLCVMGKNSPHEVKTILKDVAILLKLNMRSNFRKVKLVSQQALIHFRGWLPKTFDQIQSYLGPMANIVKVSFETKIGSEILLELKIHKKYVVLQQIK